MQPRSLLPLALAALAALGAATRPAPAQAPAKPSLVVRFKAIDDLVSDARYLAALAGREEELKQFEATLKAQTGPKGLAGLDPKKPIGLYGTVAADLTKSQAVLLLPVADETTFLSTLEKINFKAAKGDDGLYIVTPEGVPFLEKILFRFANGYLYATAKVAGAGEADLDKAGLPVPATVLAAGAGSIVAVTANLDQIPDQYKKMALVGVAQGLAKARAEAPAAETEAQKTLREAVLDEAGTQMKSVLLSSGSLSARVDLDRTAHDFSVSLRLTPMAGSKLAADVAALTPTASLSASLVSPESVMSGGLYVMLPEAIRKAIGPVIDEGAKDALTKEKDEKKRENAEALFTAFKPTLTAGVLDFGFDFRGGDKGGKYTMLLGMAVKEGTGIEGVIKKTLPTLEKKQRDALELDVDKEGDVNIHKVKPEDTDANFKRTLGDGPGYLAFRPNALIVTFGNEALAALKTAITTEPAAGKVAHFEASLKGLLPLAPKEDKIAAEAAKKAFAEKGSDRVAMTVTAGKSLTVKFTAKTQVLAFGAQVDKMKKEAGDEPKALKPD